MTCDNLSFSIPQFKMRAALCTGVGLRMESSVRGFPVFMPTLLAHREDSHCRIAAIIWQRLNNAVAGTAVRAIGKGISIASIIGIEYFLQAIRAGGNIRQD